MSEESKPVEVITVATSRGDPHGTGSIAPLEASCRACGLPMTVLGLGEQWTGFGMKMRLLAEHLQGREGHSLALFVDAFDVVLLPTARSLRERFLSFGVPLVFSAELACWPYEELAGRYPVQPPLRGPKHDSRLRALRPAPPRPNPFRYLNSGAFIGYAAAVREAIASLAPRDTDDDQGLYTLYYLEHPDKVALDSQSTLFQCLFGVQASDFQLERRDPPILHSTITGSTPCVLHGNGPGFDTLSELLHHLRDAGWP